MPGKQLKEKLIKTFQSTGGVKQIVDNVTIGPVVLDNDFVLKQRVGSILAKYSLVQSSVKNVIIMLSGSVHSAEQKSRLIDAFKSVGENTVVNNVSVQ